MNIEIWSDVACPFCLIGKRHLEMALKQIEFGDNVEVIYRSYQLDPSAPKETDKSIYELLASKYGQTVEWAKQANENVKSMGAKAGLSLDIDAIKPTNTFDAHRLIHLAKEEGKQKEAKDAFLSAYFEKGLNVSDPEVLKAVMEDLGINKDEVEKVLNSDQYASAVKEDVALSQKYGIQGVPFFLINQKYGVSGAQPVESFVDALSQIREEEVSETGAS